MDMLFSLLPSGEQGILPYYLFFVGVVSVGNSIQNYTTLHYTRRIYNGVFVPNPKLAQAKFATEVEDSVDKLVPASATGKDAEKLHDQVTPLAARMFAVWTTMAGLIRVYAAYNINSQPLYELGIITHILAAIHFTSETLVFKTIRFSGPQIFPFCAAFGGSLWMFMQYKHYVSV